MATYLHIPYITPLDQTFIGVNGDQITIVHRPQDEAVVIKKSYVPGDDNNAYNFNIVLDTSDAVTAAVALLKSMGFGVKTPERVQEDRRRSLARALYTQDLPLAPEGQILCVECQQPVSETMYRDGICYAKCRRGDLHASGAAHNSQYRWRVYPSDIHAETEAVTTVGVSSPKVVGMIELPVLLIEMTGADQSVGYIASVWDIATGSGDTPEAAYNGLALTLAEGDDDVPNEERIAPWQRAVTDAIEIGPGFAPPLDRIIPKEK